LEKVFVAQRVATKLYVTEGAIDTAMVEAAALMADLVQGRKDLGLSAVVGDKATVKVMQALAALGEARAAMVETHQELDEVKLRLGVRTKMSGWDERKLEGALKSPRLREAG